MIYIIQTSTARFEMDEGKVKLPYALNMSEDQVLTRADLTTLFNFADFDRLHLS